MNIQIDKTSDATQIKCGTVYNYGTLKVGDHEYPFTIEEMVNDNPWWVKSEITWAEDTPSEREEAEEAIMLKFEQLGASALEEQVNDKLKATADALRNMAQPSRNHMDTRTLKVNNKYRELYFDTRGGGKHIVTGEFCEAGIAEEITRRWNAHNAMRDALEHIQGHWTAANEEGNIAFALDIASCETCKALTAAALEQANK